MMTRSIFAGFGVLLLSLFVWSTHASAASVSITARNDVPGPVTAVLELLDALGAVVAMDVRTWDKNDNTFSVEVWILSDDVFDQAEDGGVLRITFVDDRFRDTGDPDDDRNLYIDNLEIDGDFREGEDFDDTGGTDAKFPGCAVDVIDGRTVADCGNENDFVEYWLDDDDDRGHGNDDDGHDEDNPGKGGDD